MKIHISEIENAFKEIFQEEEGLVKSVDTVYEKSHDEEYYKLVISIHGMTIEDTIIIHTKFIFKVDLDRKYLLETTFSYLYDINCIYHTIDFDNVIDLKNQIENIAKNNNFGEDIIILSDFITSPTTFLNYYLKREDITDYNIFDVIYEPKFKMTPCDKTTFDFKINVNNNYEIDLSINKRDKIEEEDVEEYKFRFRFMDEYKTIISDSLKNIHFTIGSGIADILNEKLKSARND